MRAFAHLRRLIVSNEDLRRKIKKKDDARFQAVFRTIKPRLETPIRPKRQIGFQTRNELWQGHNNAPQSVCKSQKTKVLFIHTPFLSP